VYPANGIDRTNRRFHLHDQHTEFGGHRRVEMLEVDVLDSLKKEPHRIRRGPYGGDLPPVIAPPNSVSVATRCTRAVAFAFTLQLGVHRLTDWLECEFTGKWEERRSRHCVEGGLRCVIHARHARWPTSQRRPGGWILAR
jgi:hypothetical protein